MDGKTLRGSGAGAKTAVTCSRSLTISTGVVLGQAEVGAKANEIPMFTPLLDRIDIAGAVITADAMHAHAGYLAGRGAYYLLTVKGTSRSARPARGPALAPGSPRLRHPGARPWPG